MIAIDMDGTALNEKHVLSKTTINTLKKLKERGIILLFATGRMPSAVIKHADQIGNTGIIVSNNGSLVMDIFTKKILLHKPLEFNVCKTVINLARKNNCILHVNLINDILIENPISKLSELYAKELGIHYKIINSFTSIHEEVTSLLFLGEKKELESILNDLQSKHNEFSHVLIPWFSNNWMLQILAPDISKGAAVIEIAKTLNISNSEIISFGDSYNDLELINLCGTGIAMENACNDLKNIADGITKSNKEDGVAYALQRLILV